MSYEVKVRHTSDSGSGISVEAKVNGEPVAHTFPKGMGFFEEPVKGRPAFVEKLEEKYEEKMKREGVSIQDTSTEESKIHSSHFENKVYGDKSKSFKEEKNKKDNMATVDLDSPEEIRTYLKENMAEGYLSEEEGLNIDKFVDRYKELLEMKQGFQDLIKELQGGKVE